MRLFSRSLGLVALTLALTFGAMYGPAAAQVNPTELAVQEEALLDALGSGEVVAGRVSIPNDRAADLIKPGGRDWQVFHSSTMFALSVWSLLGILAVLAIFYMVRGRIRIEAGPAGRTIRRFGGLERFAHWLTAVPFVILAVTGLNLVIGTRVILPMIGPEAFATLTAWGKIAHNFLAWPFMIGVLLILLVWIKDNIPSRVDGQWLAQGGGLLKRGVHPPARKFNAGQKIVFWLVVLGGISISLSGIALMFPFQFPFFAKTFEVVNAFGFDLPTDLAPVQEMQLNQLWHAIMGLFLMVVIIAHIYLGTIGMEGAFDAVSTGEVDENWAREHHALWVEELKEKEAREASGAAAE